MLNKNAQCIFCIFCILKYAKYAKYAIYYAAVYKEICNNMQNNMKKQSLKIFSLQGHAQSSATVCSHGRRNAPVTVLSHNGPVLTTGPHSDFKLNINIFACLN